MIKFRAYMDDLAYIAGFEKAFDESKHPRDSHGRFWFVPERSTSREKLNSLTERTITQMRIKRWGAAVSESGDFLRVYHGTSSEAVKEVFKDGLKISHTGSALGKGTLLSLFGRSKFYEGDRGQSVFVTNDKADAMKYAVMSSGVAGILGGSSFRRAIFKTDPAILEVHIPKEAWSNFKTDERHAQTSAYASMDISPSWIKKATLYNRKDFDKDMVRGGLVFAFTEKRFPPGQEMINKAKASDDSRIVYLVIHADPTPIEKAFNADEPRDERGRWIEEQSAQLQSTLESHGYNVEQVPTKQGTSRYFHITHSEGKPIGPKIGRKGTAARRVKPHMIVRIADHPRKSFSNYGYYDISIDPDSGHTVERALGLAQARSRGDWSRNYRTFKKMVPYAEAKPYMQEDEYIAGRAGAADGKMKASGYFSERASLRPSGPDQRGMKNPRRRPLPVADMTTIDLPGAPAGPRSGIEAPKAGAVSGDDMVPGSRMRAEGRRRTL